MNPLAVGGHGWPVCARLADLRDRGAIALRSENSGEERLISPKIRIAVVRPIQWSLDGRSLLVAGEDAENRHGLYEVNVETGPGREGVLELVPL